MKAIDEYLDRVAHSLLPSGLDSCEVYLKAGRSRRAAIGAQGRLASLHRERGWAVRASGARSSLFCSGTGEFPVAGSWPEPDGFPIKLPGPRPVADWRDPPEYGMPLCVEHEALELLEACERELRRELPEARLLQAALEDGESDSTIVNNKGVEAAWRQRTATLFLEAALGEDEVLEYVGGTSARAFNPRALARRIVDRLLIRRDGSIGDRDRGQVLLAPPVAVRILGALLPLLVGEGGPGSGAFLGRVELGPKCLDIIDDGRLAGGLFAAPVDGEGVPTGRTILVEKGTLRTRLGAGSARAADDSIGRAGCVRRPSYRDVPFLGPSHLFIRPEPNNSPASLLASVARGHYFLESQGAGRFDLEEDRFEIEVGGFRVRAGRPTATISGATLSGTVSRLLSGLEAVARDVTFFPHGGLLGAPSLLISGLDVNAGPCS